MSNINTSIYKIILFLDTSNSNKRISSFLVCTRIYVLSLSFNSKIQYLEVLVN